MPVPVPHLAKLPSHQVIKHRQSHSQPADLSALSNLLPPCPSGPPAAFGTRAEWISSLPAWRRDKPRRIWEDDPRVVDYSTEQGFPRGLTVAGNASVIKGSHAEACIPPLNPLLNAPTYDRLAGLEQCITEDDEDDTGSDYSMDYSHLDNQSQWTASSPVQDMDDDEFSGQVLPPDERGAFSPVYEDYSPNDPASSPIGPATPFGVYIDRAMSNAQNAQTCGCGNPPARLAPHTIDDRKPITNSSYASFSLSTPRDYPEEPVPVPETLTPSLNVGYKKIAEPLAGWVADYVWKVCTTGLSLPNAFLPLPYSPQQYTVPPSYLAVSVHTLLLSTLLQPSVVFLAIWYIIRLPVHFGSTVLGPEYRKEGAFRAALLGESHWGSDRTAMEATAPFRLVVLGCMLANKWLDDHTFSNKTWHSISNIPIHVLNTLETLALDAFSYDLTIPPREWAEWMTHLLSYHQSLSSPGRPQPISRPSSNPHAIIRKTIEEVIEVSADEALTAALPQPVFMGLEERRKERLERELQAQEVLEIDLDEDGPLREEYVPRRRTATMRSNEVAAVPQSHENGWDRRINEGAKHLPPPAKWSPAGDEPILRDRNRVSGHYVAVAPQIVPYPMVYHPSHDQNCNPCWNATAYVPVKPQAGYVYDFPPIPVAQVAYNQAYAAPVPLPHSRSQSLSYVHDGLQMRHHPRSYSQAIFDHQYNDPRMPACEPPRFEQDNLWTNNYHNAVLPAFGTIPTMQTAWLRT